MLSAMPRHVAIIMDGNGRWAAQRGLPRLAGHEHGTDNIRRITTAAAEIGIRYLTLWAFSTDNWRRPRDEIEGILRILARSSNAKQTSCIVRAPNYVISAAWKGWIRRSRPRSAAIERTRDNDRLVLTLAFNYSGRQELLAAVKSLVASGVRPRKSTSRCCRVTYSHTPCRTLT